MFLKFYIFSTFIWSGYAKIVADYNNTEKLLITGGYVPREHTLAKYAVSIADHPRGPLGPNSFGMGHFCAGAIIGARSILTSATCVRDKKPVDILIIAGTPNRKQKVSTTEIFIVESIKINPDYVPGEIPQHNIAIVRVNRNIATDDRNIARARLPRDYPPKENDKCTFVGWGRPKHDIYFANELRYADLVILSKRQCEEFHPLTIRTFCAGYPDYKKRTNPLLLGDAGGPLFCNKDRVCGIVNIVPKRLILGPAYFTAVHPYVSWIKRNLDSTADFFLTGGYIPSKHEFAKYTVSIGDPRPNGRGNFCAGAIIGPQSVLTSATCVHDKKPIDIIIIAGTPNLRKKVKSTLRLTVRSIKVHPGFVPGEIPKNNLAIIRTFQKMRLDYETIERIRLPQNFRPGYNDKCTLVGWGNESFPHELRYVDLFVFNKNMCEDLLPLAPKTFCAGNITHHVQYNSRSACLDDGGGPLFCLKGPLYCLYGIVNMVPNCSVFGPTYFTDIHLHYEWIEQNADDDTIHFRSSAQRQIVNSTLLKISLTLLLFQKLLF